MLLQSRAGILRPFYARTHSQYPQWTSPVKLYGKKRQPFKPTPLPPNVTTIDPRKITPENYFDISTSPWAVHYRRLKKGVAVHPQMRQFGDILYTSDTAMPEGSHGFLYMRSPSNHSPLGASVRFRLASEPSIDAFKNGSDLLLPHGLPWSIPAWEIISTKGYAELFKLLIRDRFAPPNYQLSCQSLDIVRDSNILTALGQKFVTDMVFEHTRLYLCNTGSNPIPFMIEHPWWNRKMSNHSPCAGRVIVSIVQDPGAASLSLRVDKILTMQRHHHVPGAVLPEEGQTTPLKLRAIVRSTKIKEKKLVAMAPTLVNPLLRLPKEDENHDIFDLFEYNEPVPRPLSSVTRDFAGRDTAPHLRARNA